MESPDESGDQQDSCTVSMTSHVTSRIAVKFLGRVWGPAEWLWSLYDESGDQQYSCEVSRKSLGTSRMTVESLGRALGPSG